MHTPTSVGAALFMAILAQAVHAHAGRTTNALSIPEVASTTKRTITVDDLAVVRTIDSLSVSADGKRYAILVRQAEPLANEYRSAWFSGSTAAGELVRLGDGGEMRPRVMWTGHMPGAIGASESRWSPDGQWLAYTVRSNDQVQLWRSRIDGSVQEQLTNNAADVREFAWSEDGRALYYTVGTPRAGLRAQEQARAWQGYRYDEDFWTFADLLGPQLIRPLETNLSMWLVTVDDRQERLGGEPEQAAFTRAQARDAGILDKAKAASGKVATIERLRDDDLRLCSPAAGDRLICVRETASQPAHVAAIDLRSARTQILADINPEFRNFRLGKVERFEWDTPTFSWNELGGDLAGLYPRRTYGYILYPPDFDPTRKYPVFIDPYVASGFNPVGAEHALHAYAANDIVVLRMAYPQFTRSVGLRNMYSAELGYPHLTMLMESTVLGLDTVAKRGFIDECRVGIGGVSHGTFVPLYMMQKYDRIAAISISSPHWGPLQEYGITQKARGFSMASFGERAKVDPAHWQGIDIAEHVESIEAPILMHLAAHETFALTRLIRHLADAGKPYDTYVFPGETHIKWQAAHLHAITSRNLDWFRFWLQDVEDPSPAKAEQYQRWRKLREQQRVSARDDQSSN